MTNCLMYLVLLAFIGALLFVTAAVAVIGR